MKKSLLSVAAVVFTVIVSLAQENPYLGVGRSFVGGGISLYTTNDENQNSGMFTNTWNYQQRSFRLSPTYGKFFGDFWAAGASLTIRTDNIKRSNIGDDFLNEFHQQLTRVGATLFARRYLPISERFGVYGQSHFSYVYGMGTNDNTFINTNTPENNRLEMVDIREHQWDVGIQGGLYYFVSPHFSIESNLVALTYTHQDSRRKRTDVDTRPEDDQSTTTNFSMSLVNQLSLDRILLFNYYF